jgi:hypothetical protein
MLVSASVERGHSWTCLLAASVGDLKVLATSVGGRRLLATSIGGLKLLAKMQVSGGGVSRLSAPLPLPHIL